MWDTELVPSSPYTFTTLRRQWGIERAWKEETQDTQEWRAKNGLGKMSWFSKFFTTGSSLYRISRINIQVHCFLKKHKIVDYSLFIAWSDYFRALLAEEPYGIVYRLLILDIFYSGATARAKPLAFCQISLYCRCKAIRQTPLTIDANSLKQ